MSWIKILTEKGFAFDRVSTLVIALSGSSVIIMSVIIPFINIYTSNVFIHLTVSAFIEFSIIGYWYYHRSVIPRGKKEKQNLVIAITTEDDKQKTRIAKDLATGIKKQLLTYGLNNYNVLVLNNSLSDKIQRRIGLWSDAIGLNLTDSEDVLSFFKTAKKLNAKFFVYGDLIKRNEGNSTYFMNIEALILHSNTNKFTSEILRREFSELWRKEISFLESDELNGFRSNANHIFFTASYMLGLATFVDNRFEQGINIWQSLEEYIDGKEDLKEFKPKIQQLKYQSFFMLSRLYHFEGDYEKSTAMRNRYLEIIPDEYNALLNEAIKQVAISDNPKLALELIEKAKTHSKNDGTWRYNKFYILIKLSRETDALATLDELLPITFMNELDIVGQVLSYNENYLFEDPEHIQSHFIIGVLIFKKLNNPTLAYENFVVFKKEALHRDCFVELSNRADDYIKEIDQLLGVK